MDSSEDGLNVSDLKVEEKEEEKSTTNTEASTSFCPNCVKLKRRIVELEEELSRLRGEQRDGPKMSEHNLPDNDQATPHPEQAPIEDFQGMLPKFMSTPTWVFYKMHFFSASSYK